MLIGADHQGQQACGAAKLAFVKHKLRGPPLQGQHGAGQLHAGGPGVHRGQWRCGAVGRPWRPRPGPRAAPNGLLRGWGWPAARGQRAGHSPASPVAAGAAGEVLHPLAQVQVGPLLCSQRAAASGNKAPMSTRGSRKSEPPRPANRLSAQDAQKHAGHWPFGLGRFRAEMHSGSTKLIEQTRRQALAQVGHGGLGGAVKACRASGRRGAAGPVARAKLQPWARAMPRAHPRAVAGRAGAGPGRGHRANPGGCGAGPWAGSTPTCRIERQAVAVSADEDVLAVVHPPHCALRPGNAQRPGRDRPSGGCFQTR